MTPPVILPALCVYGPQHLDGIRSILAPALAAQHLPAGTTVELHLLNYQGNQALLADFTPAGLVVRDHSATRPDAHWGFGEAVNYLARRIAGVKNFLLVNPDSFPFPGCLTALLAHQQRVPEAAIVEACQWPYAHPKEYDPHTLETPWASGAFGLIDTQAFLDVEGFDPVYFLYNEDVDLSWRLRLAGHRILYAPDARCAHYSGFYFYRADRYYYEHFFSGRNFLALSYKFFGAPGEAHALALLRQTTYPRAFQERMLASYQAIKPCVARYPGVVNSPLCKIIGFNQYHECRPF